MEQSPEYICNLIIKKDEKNKINTTVNSTDYQTIKNNMNIGLTAYESVCAPRKINNESNITFTQEQINKVIEEVLRCNICYNLFQNPVSVKGCLHKFCKSCIMDYFFKVKKECAICRHPIETKRLLKDDDKIKEIIDCFIPDTNKFKDEEDKILSQKAKEFVFKDEQRHLDQIEKIKNNKENDNSETKSNINSEHSSSSKNHHHLLNKKTTRDNFHNNNSNIKKNNNKENIKNLLDEEEEKNNEPIIIRIICDEKDNELKKYFNYTRMKVETNYTLEFISRFICYKQNFKYDQIKKINFYTLEDNLKKKEWKQSDKIRDVVNFDAKVSKNSKFIEEKIKENFYSNLYHLYLYFYIN